MKPVKDILGEREKKHDLTWDPFTALLEEINPQRMKEKTETRVPTCKLSGNRAWTRGKIF